MKIYMNRDIYPNHPTVQRRERRDGGAGVVPSRQAVRVDTRERKPIDDLVEWTYRVQKADVASAGLAHRTGYAGVSSTALICDTLALQTQVDNGGPGHRIPPDVHPDAERVHEAVWRMDERFLLLDQGRQGGAPSWCDGVYPQMVKWDGRGRPKVHWLNANGLPAVGPGKHFGYCELSYEPSWDFIDFTRELYTAWRQALVRLRAALVEADSLRDFVPVEPSAPPTPWQARSGY